MSSSSDTRSNGYVSEKNYISYASLTDAKKRPKLSRLDENATDSVVIWFKNDLRILDNPALHFGTKYAQEEQGKKRNVIGLFVYCPREMKVHVYADCKIVLMLKALESLRKSISDQLNVPLLVLKVDDPVQVPSAVVKFCVEVGAKAVFFNKQYERDEAIRDGIVEKDLARYEIKTAAYHDQCVIPPATCKTEQGRNFGVFAPFMKTWLATLKKGDEDYLKVYDLEESKFRNGDHQVITTIDRIDNLSEVAEELEASCPLVFFEENEWLTSEEQVLELADRFITDHADEYHIDRNCPSVNGTSRLSPYLALGMVSAKYLVAKCRGVNEGKLSSGSKGIRVWVRQLCRRDFYRNILVCFPYVCMNKPFRRKTAAVPWKDDEETFEKWCRGVTGFPIVDAAMRQLNETGWMHNRLRMVAAMFLTKDLLVNWQWGEKYFGSKLIDGDFASNNGGWQCAASTGTDAQPYFRIFNPVVESKKFDPKGKFIRKWVPELTMVKSRKAIHDPFGELSTAEFTKLRYPKPIVDHAVAATEAIDVFKVIYGKK